MFENYRVGVRISLIDGVSTGLSSLSGKFAKAQIAATAFQQRIDKINSSLLKSGAVAVAGFAGLGMLKHALKPATEYANQLSLINQLGLTQVQTANLVSAAWKTSHDVMTSSAAGNLKTLRELRSAFGAGHDSYAIASLAPTQMMSGMLAALTGKEQERVGFDVVKAIELRTPLMTSKAVNSNLAQMSQTVMGMGGTITPHDFHLALKGAKSAALGWTDEFVYKYLPTIMQSVKAGSGSGSSGGGAGTAGVALMSLAQAMHGMVQKAAIPYMEESGLLNKKDVVRNATGQWQLRAGAIAGTTLFDTNPYQWGVQYLTPAINKIMEKDHVSAVTAINQIFRNRNAAFVALTLYSKQQQFERDAQLIRQANGISGYNTLLKTNPQLAEMALSKQWTNMLAVLGYSVMPKLLEGIQWLIPKVQSLTDFFKKNAGAAQGLMLGLGGLAAAMAIGGTISAVIWAFKGLSLALGFGAVGGVAGITGIAAALGPVGGALLALAGAAGVVYLAYKFLHHANTPTAKGSAIPHPDGMPNPLSNPRFKNVNHPGVLTPYVDSFWNWATTPLIPHGTSPMKATHVHHHHVYIDGKEVAERLTGGNNQTGTTGMNPAASRMLPGTPLLGH